jgi:Homing endonuclease associated repeat
LKSSHPDRGGFFIGDNIPKTKRHTRQEKKTMTKEEILTAIREVAEKLGHPPTFSQLEDMTAMRRRHIRKHFGNYLWALQECGLTSRFNSRRIPEEMLFLEWARVVRKLKKIPSIVEFEGASQYTVGPYQRRCRHWTRVPEAMRDFAKTHDCEGDWQDVMDLIRLRDEKELLATGDKWPSWPLKALGIRNDRPVYGPAMAPAALVHEPINEMGVVFLFGTQAARLGFMVTVVQAEFPDCEAFVEVAPNRLQRLRIEFENESRNFLKHGHDPKGCDLIVCWKHNWPECPVEVLELKSIMANGILEVDREIGKRMLTTETRRHGENQSLAVSL